MSRCENTKAQPVVIHPDYDPVPPAGCPRQQRLHYLFSSDSDRGTTQDVEDDFGDGDGFLTSHYTYDAFYMYLQEASDIGTFLEVGFDLPLAPPMEANAFFAVVSKGQLRF